MLSAVEAVDIAHRMRDDRTVLEVLIATFGARSGSVDFDGRAESARTAVELADRLDDRLAAFTTRFQLHTVLLERAERDATRAVHAELVEHVRRAGLPYPRWQLALIESALASDGR